MSTTGSPSIKTTGKAPALVMSKLAFCLNSVGINYHKGKIDKKWSNFDHILPIFAWSFPCNLGYQPNLIIRTTLTLLMLIGMENIKIESNDFI